MRDGLLRLHEPRGDGLAHPIERHLLERHIAIERHHLGCRRSPRHSGRSVRARACVPMAASTSRATIRPCGPDGVMRPRSIPASPASRRASASRNSRPRGPVQSCARACGLRRTDRAVWSSRQRRPAAVVPANAGTQWIRVRIAAFAAMSGGEGSALAARLAAAPPHHRPRSPRPRRRPMRPRPRRRGFPRACRSWSTVPPSTPCRSRSRTGCRPASRRRRPT